MLSKYQSFCLDYMDISRWSMSPQTPITENYDIQAIAELIFFISCNEKKTSFIETFANNIMFSLGLGVEKRLIYPLENLQSAFLNSEFLTLQSIDSIKHCVIVGDLKNKDEDILTLSSLMTSTCRIVTIDSSLVQLAQSAQLKRRLFAALMA